MGTVGKIKSAGFALFGKTQRALLTVFFTRPEQSFYLREIVRLTGGGLGSVQRELGKWVDAGLLARSQRGRQVYYQANRKSPVFPELKTLAIKTAGVADVLKDALSGLAERIVLAFVHGSVAEGSDSVMSDIDVVVVGNVEFGEVVTALSTKQEVLGREVNPTVYSEREFSEKMMTGNHFLKTIKSKPKIFLMGDKRELKRLGA